MYIILHYYFVIFVWESGKKMRKKEKNSIKVEIEGEENDVASSCWRQLM